MTRRAHNHVLVVGAGWEQRQRLARSARTLLRAHRLSRAATLRAAADIARRLPVQAIVVGETPRPAVTQEHVRTCRQLLPAATIIVSFRRPPSPAEADAMLGAGADDLHVE